MDFLLSVEGANNFLFHVSLTLFTKFYFFFIFKCKKISECNFLNEKILNENFEKLNGKKV